MSKSNYLENAWLGLLFLGTPIPNLADNAAVSPITTFYVGLHTADPDEGGTQATSETAYGGYVRKAVARNGAGWVLTGSTLQPLSDLVFNECLSAPGAPITHWSVGLSTSGAGQLLYSGPLDLPITLAVGRAPVIKSATTITED